MPPRALLALVLLAGCSSLAAAGANGMIHPGRRPPAHEPGRPFESVQLEGDGVKLAAWRFRAEGPVQRGTVIYLHGIGDNRGSSVGIAQHFVALGWDVLAYDSRAHGQSGGDACTFGVYEKEDLLRVMETVQKKPIVLFGVSLGAATALQAAAHTRDVAAIVSFSVFSDLRAVANHRAPFFFTKGTIDEAFRKAEAEAHFRVDDASPLAAAPAITAPTLIIHGAKDHDTPPDHSQRVYEALRAPKRLILIPGVGHDDVFSKPIWPQIDGWLKENLPST